MLTKPQKDKTVNEAILREYVEKDRIENIRKLVNSDPSVDIVIELIEESRKIGKMSTSELMEPLSKDLVQRTKDSSEARRQVREDKANKRWYLRIW